MVDIFKQSLKKMTKETTNDQAIKQFLRTYRTTPSEALGGKTPAELFTGLKFRTVLDIILPNRDIASVNIQDYEKKSQKNFNRHHGVREKSYEQDEPVCVKMKREVR